MTTAGLARAGQPLANGNDVLALLVGGWLSNRKKLALFAA
jgi:hypothetical protein